MTETLLGCPHCGKPVGFVPTMAGQVVACPHCRGQFQMPARPPAGPSAPAPAPRAGAAARDDGSLEFEPIADPAGPGARAEPDSYRAALTLATVFALVGSAAVLTAAVLAIVKFILPIVKVDNAGTLSPFWAMIWIFGVIFLAILGIVGLFLVRSCVMVLTDAGRTLRAIERDAQSLPKTK